MVQGKSEGYFPENSPAQTEQFLQAVLQTTSEGFCVVDSAGAILDVNIAYCRMTGFSREQLLRMHIKDVEAVDSPDVIAHRLQRIKDQGIGMPKEMLSRIFDPFFTTKTKGYGLGLATSYSIINRHNGCIEVASEPGKGSTFHLYLPAAPDADHREKMKSMPVHRGTGTIVVMDDEEVMRDTTQKMLQSLGYRVIAVPNGAEALAYFTAETQAHRAIAGMIFDLTIPGAMGGKEALDEVRKIDRKVPVFVASGYAEDPIMANPQKYGFAASICKPFVKTDLINLLNKHVH